MPIVVDEVVISVEVTNESPDRTSSSASDAEERQALVDECVERVLEILQHRQER